MFFCTSELRSLMLIHIGVPCLWQMKLVIVELLSLGFYIDRYYVFYVLCALTVGIDRLKGLIYIGFYPRVMTM